MYAKKKQILQTNSIDKQKNMKILNYRNLKALSYNTQDLH